MPKNILISGASQGIGLAVGRALQLAGHQVIGTSRQPARFPDSPFPLIPLELLDDDSARAAAAVASQQLGHIDVLINNAGYDLYAAAEEAGLAETAAQLDVNFFGAVRLIMAVLPEMRQRRSGHIINMSSIGGYLGLPYNSAYAASKFALEGYSESLRLELHPFNIHVSLIEPEAVATETLATSIRGAAEPHPAYAGRSNELLKKMQQMGSQSPVTPDTVAQVVLRAVGARRPRLRYPVGQQARWIPVLKQIMPQPLFEKFLLRQFA